MGYRRSSGGDSSSEEEEEDPKWKAAIESIATTTVFANANGSSKTASQKLVATRAAEDDADDRFKPKKLTHAQIKVQKLLDEMLDKTLEIVRDPINVPDDEHENDCGVRLFKKSPMGIIFDRVDEIEGPRKKPKLLPGKGIDEKSKEFKKQLRSVAIDGSDVLAAAKEASKKSLARSETKEAAAKAKARKEEERVAELKRIRGEKWLPSIAKEMQVNYPKLGKF